MADQEMSLADVIVGKATSVPTASSSNIRTKGLMAQAVDKAASAPIPTDPVDLLPTYLGDMIKTIREERKPISSSTPDFFEENVQITAEDDLAATEEAVESQADRIVDSADATFSYPTDAGEVEDSYASKFSKNAEAMAKKANDPDFVPAVRKLADKYGITVNEIYAVINGENKDWSWNTTNKLGYKGLFQIGEQPAAEAGIDYTNITNMTPTQQVEAYDKYLERWGYDGSVPLALMQAAPSLAKRLKGKPDSTVVYTQSDDAWAANPNWRSNNKTGPITLGSLKSYYQ